MIKFPNRILQKRSCFERNGNWSSIKSLLFSTESNYFDFDLLVGDRTAMKHWEEQKFHNENEQKKILFNIQRRQIQKNYSQLFEKTLTSAELAQCLIRLAGSLPNDIHPIWNDAGEKPSFKIVEHCNRRGNQRKNSTKAESLLYEKNLAFFSGIEGKLGTLCGTRSYLFVDSLAKLARVLARYTLTKLVNEYQFTPVVVPNMLNADIIRACGFEPFSQRTQVYSFDKNPRVCLAGTAEMALAAFHLGETFSTNAELPKRYCALSRCYRAEAKSSGEASGMYRVHYFDKVEMFGLTEANNHSDLMLDEFISIQKKLFSELGLEFRVIDMPPDELGLPAYRKFDIEARMPGRESKNEEFFGEISSASNCTDYQSRRLNIKYKKFDFESSNNPSDDNIVNVEVKFVHTVNGTACAIPRIILAIVEQNQTEDGKRILIPEVLRPLMNNQEALEPLF